MTARAVAISESLIRRTRAALQPGDRARIEVRGGLIVEIIAGDGTPAPAPQSAPPEQNGACDTLEDQIARLKRAVAGRAPAPPRS